MNTLMIISIVFPILFGFISLRFEKMNLINFKKIIFALVAITSLLVMLSLFGSANDPLKVITFTDHLDFSFNVDGLSIIFGLLVSILWPITSIYAFKYMEHEGREKAFFSFFLITYGTVVGLIFSANYLTMYIFYEFLTLATIPLLMHKQDKFANYAAKKYIIYMMLGAGLGFIGLVFTIVFSSGSNFTYGGIFELASANPNLLIAYFLAFLGFSVKTAMFPFTAWLPAASVAPTPVTALLHAVAVVKSGAFALIRLTFYVFGTNMLFGTSYQAVLIILSGFTIIYTSFMALRTRHLKRRFAYSTAANLSYIVLGISFMTDLSLSASLSHFIYHAFTKILIFFIVGIVLFKTHKEYIDEINGFGRRMKLTFFCLTIASLSLSGIPPFSGFYSKYYLATSFVSSNHPLAIFAIFAVMVSAFLTVLYSFDVLIHAYFYPDYKEKNYYDKVNEKSKLFNTSIVILTVILVVFSFINPDIYEFLNKVISLGGMV